MSVMTAGEQRRRAGATRGRAIVAAGPGQQAVTAGERRSGPAPARRRPETAGRGARILTVVPSPRTEGPARPWAAAPTARTMRAPSGPRLDKGESPRRAPGGVPGRPAQSHAARPPAARAHTTRSEMAQRAMTRPGMAGPQILPPQVTRTPAVRTRVRLTRRGRIVVAALIATGVMLVAALAWLAGTARADAAGSGPPPSAVYHSLRSVVVRPGESLWAIAMQANPTGDPRSVIQQIIDLNALHGTSVQPGQRLWLPRG